MFKLRSNKKGFTLIELIVVIAILAILAAVAIPAFIGITDSASESVNLANARSIVTAFNAYQNLNPDSKLADNVSMSAAETAIGDMWPSGMDSTEEAAAWALISISNGIANATPAAPSTT